MKLVVQSGANVGQEFALNKPVSVIGRSRSCDIIPQDGKISRKHAEIHCSGAGCTLVDLGSTNGTFINERRVSGSQPLRVGDRIHVGDTIFTLQQGAAPQVMGAPSPQAVPDFEWFGEDEEVAPATQPDNFKMVAYGIAIVIVLLLGGLAVWMVTRNGGEPKVVERVQTTAVAVVHTVAPAVATEVWTTIPKVVGTVVQEGGDIVKTVLPGGGDTPAAEVAPPATAVVQKVMVEVVVTATPEPPIDPANCPIKYAPPVLLEPENGITYYPLQSEDEGTVVVFKWQWEGTLGSDEYFDVRGWPDDEQWNQAPIHYGVFGWADKRQTGPIYEHSTDIMRGIWALTEGRGGKYNWSVGIIHGDPDADHAKICDLSPEARPWKWFIMEGFSKRDIKEVIKDETGVDPDDLR